MLEKVEQGLLNLGLVSPGLENVNWPWSDGWCGQEGSWGKPCGQEGSEGQMLSWCALEMNDRWATQDRAGRETELGLGDKAFPSPAGRLGPASLPRKGILNWPKWTFWPFLDWSSGVRELTFDLGGLWKLRLMDSEVAETQGCLSMILPSAEHPVLTYREMGTVHVHIC